MPKLALAFDILANDAQARRALDRVGDHSERTGKRVGRSFSTLGRTIVGAFAGVATVSVFKGFIADAEESRKIGRLTAQVIKSTGKAAKVSAAQVADLAEAISNKTGVDDEAIQSGQNLLLTFTGIRNEVGKGNKIFDRATETITDMSVALGQDMKSSAIQVGKALNDPIRGVTALQRVGVSFTRQQKEQIKTLVESGRALDAQKIILAELGREFGGAAEAAASPMDKLRVSVGNLGEDIGGLLLPAVDRTATFLNAEAVPAIRGFVKGFQSGTGAGGKFAEAVDEVGDGLETAWKVGKPILTFIAGHPKLFTEIAVGAAGFAAAMKVLGTVKKLPGLGSLVDKATPIPVFVVNNGVSGGDLPGKGKGGAKTPVAPVAARGVALGIGSLLLTSGDAGPSTGRQKEWEAFAVSMQKLIKVHRGTSEEAREQATLLARAFNKGGQKNLVAAYDLLVKYGKQTADVKNKVAELAKDPRVASALRERAAQHQRNFDLITGGLFKLGAKGDETGRKLQGSIGDGVGKGVRFAMDKADGLGVKLDRVGSKQVAPKVAVKNLGPSISGLQNMGELITRLNGRTAGVKVNVVASGSGVTVSGGSLMTIKLADGGWVHGAGTGRSDSIPARLSNGEFVVRERMARRHAAELEAINSGRPIPQTASTPTYGDVYITVPDKQSALSVPQQLRQDAWLKGL